MQSKRIRILNFDDSVIRQRNLLSGYNPEIIELKSLAARARYFSDKKTVDDIRMIIKNRPAKNPVTFLGSGDFHHISSILIDEIEEPLSVIVFDLHPDWDSLSPLLNCGSWVHEVLKKKNILKLILIGVSSDDISTFRIQNGSFDYFEDDRLEIYPYSHKPSSVFFKRIPPNVSIKAEGDILLSRIYWNELKNKNLTEFLLHVLARLPTKKAYISIDKDCLKSEYAMTNWEEGALSLEELLLMLKLIKENTEIVGTDITGDYSRIVLTGMAKKILSYFDHPKRRDISEEAAASLNEKTNLKILDIL